MLPPVQIPIDHLRSNAWFCGSVCRKRAYRRQTAGVSVAAYSSAGGRRGRVPLGGLTQAEIRLKLLAMAKTT